MARNIVTTLRVKNFFLIINHIFQNYNLHIQKVTAYNLKKTMG